MAGYGTALCDVQRNGGGDYAEELFKESGISYKEWLSILDDERDLEIIKEYIKVERFTKISNKIYFMIDFAYCLNIYIAQLSSDFVFQSDAL